MRDTDGLLLLLLSFGEWLAGSLDRHLTHISCARRVAAVAAEKRARESEDDSQQPSKRPKQDDGNPSAPDASFARTAATDQQNQVGTRALNVLSVCASCIMISGS